MTYRLTIMVCILCVGLFVMSCSDRALVEDTSTFELDATGTDQISLNDNNVAQLFFMLGQYCANLFNISNEDTLGDAEDICHFSFKDKTYDENKQEMISLTSTYCRGVPEKSVSTLESGAISAQQEMMKYLFCTNYKFLCEQD